MQLYQVHETFGLLLPADSTASNLYMCLAKLMAREYVAATTFARACQTDLPLTPEEQFYCTLFEMEEEEVPDQPANCCLSNTRIPPI